MTDEASPPPDPRAVTLGDPALPKELPPLPDIGLELLDDLSPPQPAGFLKLVRRRFAARYPDGSVSAAFIYDEVDRPALDAVVIVAHFMDEGGARHVYLRSSLRPPVAMRHRARSPEPERDGEGVLWELPAGLIEPGEQSVDGVLRCAARELAEELGFDRPPSAFRPLGPSSFPTPAVVAERHFYVEVEVDPRSRREPELDGSPLERGGLVAHLPLASALAGCRAGAFDDTKTELGLRRLGDRFA